MRSVAAIIARSVLIWSGVALCPTFLSAETPAADKTFRAIRDNRLDDVKRLAAGGGANAKNKLQMTPLHYAAIYGSVESVKLLIEAGADVNAQDNRQATPLIYGAYSFEKTRLLVEHGATVNVAARNGVTPLVVAASYHGDTATVRYLLAHGANVNVPKGTATSPLDRAAEKGDVQAVQLLLEHGAERTSLDQFGPTPLFFAAIGDPGRFCDEKVALLIPGSDVNALNTFAGQVKNGPIALTHMSALMWAVQGCPADTAAQLLKAGANVNEHDVRGLTPLMMAVATDQSDPDMVKVLLAAGADVNAKDINGETAMDWALKFRNPGILKLFTAVNAPHSEQKPAPVRPAEYQPSAPEALKRSADLLAKTAETFWPAGGGCVACHSQPPTARAYVAMSDAGLNPPESMKRMFTDGMLTLRTNIMNSAPFLEGLGGDYDNHLFALDALADTMAPASDTTDIILHYLASRQEPSGEWATAADRRPPVQGDAISRTAQAIRAIKLYSWPGRRAEFDERMARAKHWLLEAKADTVYEKADRLLGLYWAGAGEGEMRDAARQLETAQSAGGGWAQTKYLQPDAYATGLALYALRTTHRADVTDQLYRRGVKFLLETQMPDGSWYVRSRAMKLQPYFQSGFPYDHDQWISNAATAWAVMAIAPAATVEQARR